MNKEGKNVEHMVSLHSKTHSLESTVVCSFTGIELWARNVRLTITIKCWMFFSWATLYHFPKRYEIFPSHFTMHLLNHKLNYCHPLWLRTSYFLDMLNSFKIKCLKKAKIMFLVHSFVCCSYFWKKKKKLH